MESTPTWLIGPETPAASRIGTVLNGTYRLDAFLGQGVTGTSYNAWHLRQKSPYAIKLLHRQLAPSHERVLHLRHDLRALASLGRFGFLPVDLSFAPDGAPFLAAELLVGAMGPAGQVALLVNRGDRGASYVMPDLIGVNGERAADILRNRGFRVAVVGSQPYPGVAPGIVIRQSPQAGFQIGPGEPISLEVSR